MTTRIAIIGGGAAGCFAAICLKERMPEACVTVYESGNKLLAKVAVTGGGRCNLTNSFRDVRSIEAVYPRGSRLMKRLLREFSHVDAYKWFESKGIRLVTQDDQCVFPASQDAMEIVATLTRLMKMSGVIIKTRHRVNNIMPTKKGDAKEETDGRFSISFSGGDKPDECADVVMVTTGGSPKPSGLEFLNSLNLEISHPVPSLFSMCTPGHDITRLTGTVVDNVTTGLTGTKLRANGPLLITHWGMSGPSILRLSSYAARFLHGNGYKAELWINWFGDKNETEVAEHISTLADEGRQKQMCNTYPRHLNGRLWEHILKQSGLKPEMRWAELGNKGRNRLVSTLTNDRYMTEGKNKFKEEFVTCGGVALSNISAKTLESKNHEGLYFAGEILDVDAVTGGFNLQAAWTMGYVAAKSIAMKHGRQ